MAQDNYHYLRWSCRRGMLELDLILSDFIEKQYFRLSLTEKKNFQDLLLCTDVELIDWLLNGKLPAPAFSSIVQKIQLGLFSGLSDRE